MYAESVLAVTMKAYWPCGWNCPQEIEGVVGSVERRLVASERSHYTTRSNFTRFVCIKIMIIRTARSSTSSMCFEVLEWCTSWTLDIKFDHLGGSIRTSDIYEAFSN